MAVVDFLGDALPGPAIIAFDDVHLADDASHDIAGRLASIAGEHDWLVVSSALSLGEGLAGTVPGVETIQLGPLDPVAIESLVAASIGDAAHPLDVAGIVERSEGNPFYVLQLCMSLRTTGEALPDAVETVVAQGIDNLPPDARQFLRIASVLGVLLHGPLLAKLSGTNGAVTAGVPPAGVHDYLHQAEERPFMRFTHRLVQEAAYESLPYRERRQLHEKTATLIESGAVNISDQTELLALHYARAGNHERAWQYALEAGRRARAKQAHVEAAGFFEDAIQSARRLSVVEDSELAAVLEEQGDVCEILARYADAEVSYGRARRLAAGRPVTTARLLRKQAMLKEHVGQYSDALRQLRRASRVLEDLEHDADVLAERSEVLLSNAGVRFRQGRYRDCVDSCRQAILVAQAAGLRAAEAHGYYLIENALSLIGHPEAVRYRDSALPIYEEIGDLVGQANVLNNLGVTAYHEGRLETAIAVWQRSRLARETAGDVVGAATQMNNIAEALSDQGNLEAAEALLVAARRTFERTHSTVQAGIVVSNLGRLATRAGRLDEGEELLQSALDVMRELGAVAFEMQTEFFLAENAAARDDLGKAEERLVALEARLTHGAEHSPLRSAIGTAREEWGLRDG